jgi:hypothetical protein
VAEINAVAKTDIDQINERIAEIAKSVGESTPTATGATKPKPKAAKKAKATA